MDALKKAQSKRWYSLSSIITDAWKAEAIYLPSLPLLLGLKKVEWRSVGQPDRIDTTLGDTAIQYD